MNIFAQHNSSLLRIVFIGILGASFIATAIPLSVAAADGPNLIANSSFETGTSGNPTSWARGRYGTNEAQFIYPVAGFEGARGAEVRLASYSSGDAKWYFNDVSVIPGRTYRFSDYSKSNVTSYVTVRLRFSNGTFSYVDIGVLPPSTSWRKFEKLYAIPTNVMSLTVFHLIKSVGTLTVDTYSLSDTTDSAPTQFPEGMVSLTFDDGWKTTYETALPILNSAGIKSTQYVVTGRFSFPAYINADQVRAMQTAGHEIGAHTRTHRDLTALSESEMRSEIIGSRDDLLSIGITSVKTFAYPFGAYNGTTDAIVRGIYISARTSNGGNTDRNENKYLLERHSIEAETTFAQVKGWIDTAVRDKKWQILVFHRVDASGTAYSTTPEMLQSIVDYLIAQRVKLVTVTAGAALMN